MTLIARLKRARTRVRKGWVRGSGGAFGKTCCLATAGCDRRNDDQARVGSEYCRAIFDVLPERYRKTHERGHISNWNDHPERTKAQALAALELAIAAQGGI